MPRPRTERRPVQVKLDPEQLAAVEAVAAADPALSWDGQPSTSAAIRRLLREALDQREPGTVAVAVKAGGLVWIDEQAAASGVDRDEMVRVLLREAMLAREARKPDGGNDDRRKP